MAAPQSSPLPEAPTRGEAEGQFVPKANAFVDALEPFRQQLQAQADYVNTRTSQLEQAATRAENAESGALDAEATSAANANFAGNWSSLSGSYSVPTSVFHEGYFWALVQNVSSIGDHEPGESSAWVIIQRAFRELSVEPTLSSNFRTGEHKLYGVQDGYKSRDLADIWDVTRASGETVLTPAGRIATVDPDTLPLTYVPVTGGLGAQITGAVTNLFLWSEDFSQSVWRKVDRVTVEEYSPSGSQPDSINLVVPTEVQGRHWLSQHLSITQSVGVTFSAFFKASGYDYVMVLATGVADPGNRATIDLQTGEIINTGDGVGASIKLSDGWYFFSVFMPASDAGSIGVQISVHDIFTSSLRAFTGDGESGVYMWGAQLTEGSTLFPYVKTEASTVTKPATKVVRELGEEFNREEFTLLMNVGIGNGGLGSSAVIFAQMADSRAFGRGLVLGMTGSAIFVEGRIPGGSANPRAFITRQDARKQARIALRFRNNHSYSLAYSGEIRTQMVAVDLANVLQNLFVGDARAVSDAELRQDNFAISDHYLIPRALSDAELIEWTRGGS